MDSSNYLETLTLGEVMAIIYLRLECRLNLGLSIRLTIVQMTLAVHRVNTVAVRVNSDNVCLKSRLFSRSSSTCCRHCNSCDPASREGEAFGQCN
jgi:uncharacterized membrane protein YdbT with pleckstrin-like domain